ncbi:hypothetical protein [Haloarcula sp. 1CSR25-25]|uniref:hypothetical protein n=1 Tax=Haloarcula sp. 1CSR25-25 TaxID=2862545 RepID=UPI002895B4C9|nr:hypothetical protein [Haloarcula sp. 1CSR25-25]MDT3436501.1 hypothetical protein [Haloarcula sp. 1CSR25-25]
MRDRDGLCIQYSRQRLSPDFGFQSSHTFLSTAQQTVSQARDLDIIIFDKTGTLTEGEHGVVGMETVAGVDKDNALARAGGYFPVFRQPAEMSHQLTPHHDVEMWHDLGALLQTVGLPHTRAVFSIAH